MKPLRQFINEVSKELARKAASRQRQKLDDDDYLDGKTAKDYKRLLKRAENFEKYAAEKEAKEKVEKFKYWCSGELIYDHNNIQVTADGNCEYSGTFNIISDDYDDDPDTVEQEGTMYIKSDIYSELDEDDLPENYEFNAEDWADEVTMKYPTLRFYYKHETTPIFTIKGLALHDFYAHCGPGGYSYYNSSYFGGSLRYDDIDADEDTNDLREDLKGVIGSALADVINMPLGYPHVEYDEESWRYCDCDEVLDDICDEF